MISAASRDGRRGFDLITFIFDFRFLLGSIANVGTPITHSLSMDWDIERTYYLIVLIIRPYQFWFLRVPGDKLEKSCSQQAPPLELRRPTFRTRSTLSRTLLGTSSAFGFLLTRSIRQTG